MRLGRGVPAWLVLFAVPGFAQFPLTPEVRVHDSSAAFEERPDVAIDDLGRSIVVWSTSHDVIHARSFHSAGIAHGEARLVHTAAGAFRNDPQLALNPAGEGYVAWSSNTEPGLGFAGPFAACIVVDGDAGCPVFALPTGDRLLNGEDPAVALSSAGELAAFWFTGGTDTRPDRLAAGVYGAGGQATTANFVVESDYRNSAPPAGHWRVASLAAGRFVAVWAQQADDDSGHGIRARIYSASGVPMTDEFQVETSTPGDQLAPDVASDLAGNFVVVWEDYALEADGSGIYGQRFDSSGQKVGSQFRVSSEADSMQFDASVDMDDRGNFVVAFISVSESIDSSIDVFARAFRADGSPAGPQQWVTEGAPVFNEQRYPAVSLSNSGEFVVAYESYRCESAICSWDVMARWYNLPCEETAESICLGDGRFRARARWKTPDGRTGVGHSIPLASDSGGFSFFAPGVVELLVKIVDGCSFNERFWLFASGLTDVEVDLLVQDTWTGSTAIVHNDLGQAFLPSQSIDAFGTCQAAPPGALPRIQPTSTRPLAKAMPERAPSGSEQLELQDGRFVVTAQWNDFSGEPHNAFSRPFSSESGFFYFFEPSNIELAIKVVDACSLTQSFWVYAAGLTNTAVQLRVLDLESQRTWEFQNLLGNAFPAVLDTVGFPTCSAQRTSP